MRCSMRTDWSSVPAARREGRVLWVSAVLQAVKTLIPPFISAKGFLCMPGQITQPLG